MPRILPGLLALCLAPPLGAACPQLVVEPYDPGIAGAAAEPSLANAGEEFLLTWQARLEGGRAALRFLLIDDAGRATASGEIGRGTGWFLNWADFPSALVLDNGDWVTHWLQRSDPVRSGYDIRSLRSRERGRTWSAPFTLHDDHVVAEHGFVAYVPAGGDAAWAVWLDGRNTGQGTGDGHWGHHGSGATSLRAALLSRDGVVWSGELDDRVCDCCQIDATRAAAATLVVYRDRDGTEVRDVSLVIHDGRRWGTPKTLFPDGWRIAGCPVNGPAIAAQGRHVVAAAYSEAGGTPAVRLRRSDDGGLQWSDVVTVFRGQTAGRLDLAVLEDGRALLARIDDVESGAVLRLGLYGAEGRELAQADVAQIPAGRLAGFPRLALRGDTGHVVWTLAKDGRPQVRAARVRVRACAEP